MGQQESRDTGLRFLQVGSSVGCLLCGTGWSAGHQCKSGAQCWQQMDSSQDTGRGMHMARVAPDPGSCPLNNEGGLSFSDTNALLPARSPGSWLPFLIEKERVQNCAIDVW